MASLSSRGCVRARATEPATSRYRAPRPP
jgi:hypothetical protein